MIQGSINQLLGQAGAAIKLGKDIKAAGTSAPSPGSTPAATPATDTPAPAAARPADPKPVKAAADEKPDKVAKAKKSASDALVKEQDRIRNSKNLIKQQTVAANNVYEVGGNSWLRRTDLQPMM